MNKTRLLLSEQREYAFYASDMLKSLARIATQNKMDVLARLIELAQNEAERGTSQPKKAA
jgi:hypothetical protein